MLGWHICKCRMHWDFSSWSLFTHRWLHNSLVIKVNYHPCISHLFTLFFGFQMDSFLFPIALLKKSLQKKKKNLVISSVRWGHTGLLIDSLVAEYLQSHTCMYVWMYLKKSYPHCNKLKRYKYMPEHHSFYTICEHVTCCKQVR